MTLTLVDDPRTTFDHATALATAVIGRVGTHQLRNATPCTEFDVQALLDHMVTVLRRVAALGRGDDPFGPQVLAPVEGAAAAAWLAAVGDVAEAWADDDVLTRTVRLPWSETTGAAMLVSYLNEVTVHTWDVAVATGQRPAWDPAVLSLAVNVRSRLHPVSGGQCTGCRWSMLRPSTRTTPPLSGPGDAVRELDRRGEPVTFATVARASGGSRSFLNKVPALATKSAGSARSDREAPSVCRRRSGCPTTRRKPGSTSCGRPTACSGPR